MCFAGILKINIKYNHNYIIYSLNILVNEENLIGVDDNHSLYFVVASFDLTMFKMQCVGKARCLEKNILTTLMMFLS